MFKQSGNYALFFLHVGALKGVMRVGVLAKGLLLHERLDVDLVVLCHGKKLTVYLFLTNFSNFKLIWNWINRHPVDCHLLVPYVYFFCLSI